DIQKFLDGIADNKRLRALPGHGDQPLAEARSITVCLGTMFKWAEAREFVTANPMAKITKGDYGETNERDRVLDDPDLDDPDQGSKGEIKAVWAALDEIGWPHGHIGQLILLTAQRPGEVAGLRWSEINQARATWTIPKGRAKNDKAHIVHLSPQA